MWSSASRSSGARNACWSVDCGFSMTLMAGLPSLPGGKKLFFLLRESLDDLFGRQRRWRGRLGFRADAAGDAMFGRRGKRSLRSVLSERGEAQSEENDEKESVASHNGEQLEA